MASDVKRQARSKAKDQDPAARQEPLRQQQRFEKSVEAVRAGVRRANGEEGEIGERAGRTRKRLLVAADEQFCARGYSAVSVNDIAVAAGVRLPTVYQYFNGRAGIFAALVGERAIEMMSRGVDAWVPESGRKGLERVIHDFVETYAANRYFFRAWEEAAQVEPTISELRREWNRVYKVRLAQAVRSAQKTGIASSAVDAEEASRWLARGLECYCFDALLFDPPSEEPSIEDITSTLLALWCSTLGVAN